MQAPLSDYFSGLLALAQLLLRTPQELVAAAGAALYRSLFSHFPDAYCQQASATPSWQHAQPYAA